VVLVLRGAQGAYTVTGRPRPPPRGAPAAAGDLCCFIWTLSCCISKTWGARQGAAADANQCGAERASHSSGQRRNASGLWVARGGATHQGTGGAGRAWKLAYWRMQNGCAVLRVMACSQNTCSGHCTTAALRMRFSAYCRPDASSARRAAGPPACQAA